MFTRLMMKKPGTTVMALASLGAVLTVAGCTASGTQGAAAAEAGAGASVSASAAAAATPTVNSSAQSTATAQQGSGGGSGSSSSSSSGSGSGSQSAPACLLSSLTINTGPYLSPAGTGIAAEPIILTNTGPAACTVLGWPGVAALNGGGSQVYQAARIGPKGSPITLARAASASAVLYAVISLGGPGYGGSSSCTQVPNLLVTPPNETHSGAVGFGSPVCVPPALTALLPGAGGGAVSASAEYYEALQLWKKGATAMSAAQGSYEIQANNMLVNALGAGVAGTGGFLKAAQQLTQLSALPDAMMNSTQEAEFNADATALNTFFGTSGLYN